MTAFESGRSKMASFESTRTVDSLCLLLQTRPAKPSLALWTLFDCQADMLEITVSDGRVVDSNLDGVVSRNARRPTVGSRGLVNVVDRPRSSV